MRRGAAGFSLLEMAIVLAIAGLLLGGLLVPLAARVEHQRRLDAQRQIDYAIAALLGYAAATGYLPCPARPDSEGREARSGATCASAYGFLPNATLAMSGAVNRDGLLVDPWNHPLRYAVSLADANRNGIGDFVGAGEMQVVGLGKLSPDLRACEQASCTRVLANGIPAVVYSLGGNAGVSESPDERANAESIVTGGPSGMSYAIASNRDFVSAPFSDVPGKGFDDIIAWISPNLLYTRLIEARRLP